jgi:hypothetical protein
MFGVVPKTIWNKTNPADANNLIDIAARCLLLKMVTNDFDRHRNGNKQSEKFMVLFLWEPTR